MSLSISNDALDAILTLQLAIAWAGEARSDPPRLGWWQTDLVDGEGGGDFLRRLLPQTHEWAALESVREAARRTDARLRNGLARPDELRSLFSLGFELDEKLNERLRALKRSGQRPHEALSSLPSTTSGFDAEAFGKYLRPSGASAEFTIVPGGRELRGEIPSDPARLVASLASALVPFAPQFPLPHARVGT